MKTFVYSAHAYDIPFLSDAAGRDHELLFTNKKLTAETAHFANSCEAIAVFTADDCRGEILEQLHSCGVRYIALRSVGYDHVDLEKASELGIAVANVPEYSPHSVAEHAVTLLLALNRKIIDGQALMRLQDFRLDSLVGFDLHGKKVGIIGTGNIGLAFAKIMRGFGCRLLAHDPSVNTEALAIGVRYSSLEELLNESDIVSVHCPLNSNSRHMISLPQFNMMRRTSILINTARGAIINTNDLVYALENELIAGACLDVLENEQKLFFEDHTNEVIRDNNYQRLRNFKNVIITGHQAFLTREALNDIARTTIHNLTAWETLGKSPHQLNSVAAAHVAS